MVADVFTKARTRVNIEKFSSYIFGKVVSDERSGAVWLLVCKKSPVCACMYVCVLVTIHIKDVYFSCC